MRAIFLDRDGVINRKAPEGEYIRNWSEVELVPGVVESLAVLSKAGFKLIVVTNQRGVALGKVQLHDLLDIHARLADTLGRQGIPIAAFYFCAHEKSAHCDCRKPEPGLLFRAAREHSLELGQCWMIGDSPTDIEAGKRAACRTVFLAQDRGLESAFQPDVVARSWPAATGQILAREFQDRTLHPFS